MNATKYVYSYHVVQRMYSLNKIFLLHANIVTVINHQTECFYYVTPNPHCCCYISRALLASSARATWRMKTDTHVRYHT